MKKLVPFVGLLALTLVAVFATAIPQPAEARYPRPACGECRDGTLNLPTLSCPGDHTNCTECTVCG